MRVVISQLGAREHYAPAVMAERAGELARLVTDIWNIGGPTIKRVGKYLGWKALMRFSGRYSPEIPSEKVVALYLTGLYSYLRVRRAANRSARYAAYLEGGQRFAERTIRHLDVDHDVFFGFNSASLEALRHENRVGVQTVLDQIDPARIEAQIVYDEERKFRTWIDDTSVIPESYFDRLAREWDEANAILVNSAWSKRALIQQGVPAEKVHVVPLPYAGRTVSACEPCRRAKARLKVLWLGTLTVRKGIFYAFEAAEQLSGAPIEFTFAGPLAIRRQALSRLPGSSRWIGQVPRSLVRQLFAAHDVLLFPTLSDGFGLVQVEAMSHSLPVIATENCGEVVQHGSNGFVIPAGESRPIVDALLRLLEDQDLLRRMSLSAQRRSLDFRLDRIWPRCRALLSSQRSELSMR